jgi:predicted ATPase/DNA-binding CsgD family transcriptional regulator
MADLDQPANPETLTEREHAIMRLLDEGLSDRDIAAKLFITPGTVKWYNRQIYGKLGVVSRTQAVHRARELNLIARGPQASTPRPAAPRHNLPAETTQFIGRQRELQTARQLLRTTRLLTLTGSPGAGKTRLGLRLAADALAEFAAGACFVNLAPLDNPAYVAMAIADALEVQERPDQSLEQTLRETLRAQALLLILDNFEHLLPAAPLVADLLVQAPRLKIVVTSREPLHLHSEQEYPVPPLELPAAQASDLETLAQCEAVALFVQQARAVRPDFTLNADNVLDIAKICVRLDGLPLALELAAAQSKLLTPHAILDRLASRPLAALVNGARDLPVRQQTLRQTIEWSYNLLDAAEKVLFTRLGVFAGGWTLDAMQTVCCAGLALDPFEGLEALVNKSLARQHEVRGAPRFDMLETIRAYALEQLAARGELETLRHQHAGYYTELAEMEQRVVNGVGQRSVLDNLEVEHDNYRAALGWSQGNDAEPGLRLIAALGLCWQLRGHLPEGARWSQSLLALSQPTDPTVRAKALYSASLLALRLGDGNLGAQFSQEALRLARQTGDPVTVAWSLFAVGAGQFRPDMTAEAHRQANADIDEALSLFQAHDLTLGTAQCLMMKGEACRLQGEWAQAATYYQESASQFSQLGNPAGRCVNLSNLGWVALRLGDAARAATCFRESQDLARQIHYPSVLVGTLAGLAGLALGAQQPEQAARLLGVVEAQLAVYRDALGAADWADYAACIAAARAQLDPAVFARLWSEGRGLTLEQALTHATPVSPTAA